MYREIINKNSENMSPSDYKQKHIQKKERYEEDLRENLLMTKMTLKPRIGNKIEVLHNNYKATNT